MYPAGIASPDPGFASKESMIQVSARHEAVKQGAKAAGSAHSAHGLHWLMGFGTLGLFAVSLIDVFQLIAAGSPGIVPSAPLRRT